MLLCLSQTPAALHEQKPSRLLETQPKTHRRVSWGNLLVLRKLGFMAVSCISTVAVYAQTPLVFTAEERLAAIQQNLLQAALLSPTEVSTMSWIDSQGVLRESSSFKSGMQVRGVKVVSYERDTQGEAKATMQWDTSTTPPASGCQAKQSKLVHSIDVVWSQSDALHADDTGLLDALHLTLVQKLQSAHAILGASAGSQGWRLVEKSPTTAAGNSAYERALLGTSADNAQWTLHLNAVLVPKADHAKGKAAFAVWGGRWPSQTVQWQATLIERNNSKPLLQTTQTVVLQGQQAGWGALQLQETSQVHAEKQALALAQTLDATLLCKPLHPQVTQASGGSYRINAGSLAGVKVGDEWLLHDSKQIPKRMLEGRSASSAVLARVQSVRDQSAQLQWLAGPQAAVRAEWRAWAAE